MNNLDKSWILYISDDRTTREEAYIEGIITFKARLLEEINKNIIVNKDSHPHVISGLTLSIDIINNLKYD